MAVSEGYIKMENRKVVIFNDNERMIMSFYDACQEFHVGRKLLKSIINTGISFSGYFIDWVIDYEQRNIKQSDSEN